MIKPRSTKESQHYFAGGKLAVENANALYKIAIKAEQEQEYGVCKSLLILSCEEAIKSFALLIQSMDERKLHSGFKKIMKNHKAKHHVIYGMLGQIDERIKNFPIAEKRIRNQYPHMTDEEYDRNILSNKYYKAEKKLVERLSVLNIEFSKAQAWWLNANHEKNRGLYTEELNGTWQTPRNIKAKELQKPKKYIEGLFIYIDYLVVALEDHELFDHKPLDTTGLEN